MRIKWNKDNLGDYSTTVQWSQGVFSFSVRAQILVCPDGRAMSYIVTPADRTEWAGKTFPSVRSAKTWAAEQIKRYIPRDFF